MCTYFSQRLREMSESLKKTYDDDHLLLSPYNSRTPPLDQPHGIQAQFVSFGKSGEILQPQPTGDNELQNNMAVSINTNVLTSINKDNTEGMSQSGIAGNSKICDVDCSDEIVVLSTGQDTSPSANLSKLTNKDKTKNGKSFVSNKANKNSVTIPRTHKSQQDNIRQSIRVQDGNPAATLSRSYQHPPSHNCENRNNADNIVGNGVSMRRSSSVPCKRITVERGSTSSSDDSGFSPGSPNTSATLNVFNLEQAVRGMHLDGPSKTTKSTKDENKPGSESILHAGQDFNGHSTDIMPFVEEGGPNINEMSKTEENPATSLES